MLHSAPIRNILTQTTASKHWEQTSGMKKMLERLYSNKYNKSKCTVLAGTQ